MKSPAARIHISIPVMGEPREPTDWISILFLAYARDVLCWRFVVIVSSSSSSSRRLRFGRFALPGRAPLHAAGRLMAALGAAAAAPPLRSHPDLAGA